MIRLTDNLLSQFAASKTLSKYYNDIKTIGENNDQQKLFTDY
jgi:hypothetical protein